MRCPVRACSQLLCRTLQGHGRRIAAGCAEAREGVSPAADSCWHDLLPCQVRTAAATCFERRATFQDGWLIRQCGRCKLLAWQCDQHAMSIAFGMKCRHTIILPLKAPWCLAKTVVMQ